MENNINSKNNNNKQQQQQQEQQQHHSWMCLWCNNGIFSRTLCISSCEQTPQLSASSFPIIVVYVRLRHGHLRLVRHAVFSVLHLTSLWWHVSRMGFSRLLTIVLQPNDGPTSPPLDSSSFFFSFCNKPYPTCFLAMRCSWTVPARISRETDW